MSEKFTKLKTFTGHARDIKASDTCPKNQTSRDNKMYNNDGGDDDDDGDIDHGITAENRNGRSARKRLKVVPQAGPGQHKEPPTLRIVITMQR